MLCINLGWRAEPLLAFSQQLYQRKTCKGGPHPPEVPADTLLSFLKPFLQSWGRAGLGEALGTSLVVSIFSLRLGFLLMQGSLVT